MNMTFKKGYDPKRSTGSNPRKTEDGKSLPNEARKLTGQALKRVEEILNNPDEDSAIVLKAAKLIFDRGWGMARQVVDVNRTTEHQHHIATVDVSKLSLDALRQLANASLNEPKTIEGELLPAPTDDDLKS